MKSVILLLSLILTLVLSKVCEAQDWRASLPPDWLGVVVVHDLPEFDRQADRMAKSFGMEAPQMVRLLESSGLTDVTDVKRSWIAGLARNSEGIEGIYPFAFVPVTDFKAFVDAYDGDINGKSAIVTIEQRDLLAGNCGKWTLLMSLDYQEVLESIVNRRPEEQRKDVGEVDAKGIATFNLSGSGLKWLAEYHPASEQPSREQAIARRKRGLAMLSPEGIRESLTLDKPLWEWLSATFSDVKMSVAFDAEGGAKLEFSADLSKGDGPPNQQAKADWGGEQSIREDRPWISKAYLLPSEAIATMTTGLQTALLKSTPEDLGIDNFAAAELDKFENSLAKAIEQVTVAQVVTLANDDLPIYGNRLVLLNVGEESDFVDACDRLMQDWNALISTSNAEVKILFSSEPVEIAGHKGKRYYVDMVEAVDVPRSREVVKVMEEMFGPDGILNWYVLTDPTLSDRMIVSNLPHDELTFLLTNGADGTFHPANPGLSMQFDASTYVDWCKRRDRAMQGEVIGGPRFVPMPKSKPVDASVTVSESRLKIELKLPPSLLQTLGKYSQELRQQ